MSLPRNLCVQSSTASTFSGAVVLKREQLVSPEQNRELTDKRLVSCYKAVLRPRGHYFVSFSYDNFAITL